MTAAWAALAAAILLLAAGAPARADETAFGPKRWLLNPPPERPTAVQEQRGAAYRFKLQRELSNLERPGERLDLRKSDRRQNFRAELPRIRRALRNPGRIEPHRLR